MNGFTGFWAIEKDDSVLLVQNHANVKAKLTKYAAVTFSILLIFIVCVIFRKLFRLVAHEKYGDAGEVSRILLNTWGVLLLTSPSERTQNRSERILLFFFVVFSMVLSIMASAFLLGNILAKETRTGINTLKELAESKLPICISTVLNETRSEWAPDIE